MEDRGHSRRYCHFHRNVYRINHHGIGPPVFYRWHRADSSPADHSQQCNSNPCNRISRALPSIYPEKGGFLLLVSGFSRGNRNRPDRRSPHTSYGKSGKLGQQGYAIYRRRFRACRYYCRRQAHTTEASRLKKHSAGSSARLKWGTGRSWKLSSIRLWSLTRITGSLSGTRLLRRCSGTQRTKRPDYPSPNSSGTATMEFRPMETRFAFHQRGVIVKRNRYSVLSEEREHVSCRIGAVPADGFRLNAQYVHHP
jgi:hypothetical protein